MYHGTDIQVKIKCSAHPLFVFKWFRVILDEAHIIRNRAVTTLQNCPNNPYDNPTKLG